MMVGERTAIDDLTRAMAGGAGPRRPLFRLLTGSALAGLAGWFGHFDIEARRRRKRDADRKEPGPLHDERKGRKKRKNKRRKKQRMPAAEEPRPCGAGERQCDDGSCVDSGQCCPGHRSCADGECVAAGVCCSGERQCDGECLPAGQCCPGKRRCADGSCISRDQCCSDEWGCDDGSCVPVGGCCPDAAPPSCGACEEEVCENGWLVCRPIRQCPANEVIDPATCQCECPQGSVVLADGVCCPSERACNANAAGRATTCCSVETICVAGEVCS